MKWFFVPLSLLLLLAPASTAFTQTKEPCRRTPLVKAIEKVRESTVVLQVTLPARSKPAVATGTVVDALHILTTRHVVGSEKNIDIVLSGGTKCRGTVIATDASCDLALIQVEGQKLSPVQFATKADVLLGEEVAAIGHPYGYTFTVTRGIVSSLNREIIVPTGEVLTGILQTDAAVNPGNSGGPLFDMEGKCIGIVVALRDGAENIAFAVSSDTVKAFLKKHRKEK